jgi:death-on-curing protein
VTRYITLAEYMWLAEQVTGVDAAVLVKASRVDLADSALAAPAAGFGDQEFYPDLLRQGCGARVPPVVEPSADRWQQARRMGVARAVHRPQRRPLGSRSA